MPHTTRSASGGVPTLLGALLLAATSLLGSTAPAEAQGTEPRTYSAFSGSLSLLNMQPLGSLATGPGWGVDLSGAWAPVPGGVFRIKADFRGAIYGRDTRRACLSETIGCLIEVDVNTDYTSYYVGLGPELAFSLGGPTLVLDASAGFGGFGVTSSVEGISDTQNEDLFRTDNFSETHFSYSAGGQLRIPVSGQISIALGVHYQYNGEATYVPPGGVTLNPDGSVNVDERTTDANQVALTLGVAFHPFVGLGLDSDER